MTKYICFFAIFLTMVLHVKADQVSVNEARATAQRFACSMVDRNRSTGNAANNIQLVHTEVNTSNVNMPVYYIFNTNAGFVIVSGDDRTQEILAHGDSPLAIEDMPENMQLWLSFYKAQLEYLQSHPDAVLDNPMNKRNRLESSSSTTSVKPLLTANWSQAEPYNWLCPAFLNNALCLTGCAATSLSTLFHYWKYPTDSIPEIEGYTYNMVYNSIGYHVTVPSIPSVRFDWDNMLDSYPDSGYTKEQAMAVALLMRHVGQAERMNYGPSSSGAVTEDIIRAVNVFGYGDYAQHVVKSTTDIFGVGEDLICDDDWSAMIYKELSLGRPILYLAYCLPVDDPEHYIAISGHAFNVDGYDASNNTYHVNWGWNGKGNGYFALNVFTGSGRVFNIGQSMIIGLEPPFGPVVKAPGEVDIKGYIDQTTSGAFFVEGRQLTGAVALTLNDPDGVFGLETTSISAQDAMAGQEVEVTYSPAGLGHHTATITISSPGVDDIVVTINGDSYLEVYRPLMLSVDSSSVASTQFRAEWTDRTSPENISSYTLEVSQTPSTMLLAEADFSDYPEVIGNLAADAGQYLPAGWSFEGGGFWLDGGCIELCSGSVLTSSSYDLSQYDSVTVVVTAKNWSKYNKASLTVATSQSSECFTMTNSYVEYTAVLGCEALETIYFTAGYYPMIQRIAIYAGELKKDMKRGVTEIGDSNYRLISGINDWHYTVTGLESGGTFFYKVKAHYVDGSESPWSLAKRITLFSSDGVIIPGDVDNSGTVDIDDLTLLINYLLTGDTFGINLMGADVNTDDTVSIDDLSVLINFLLTHCR